VRAIEKFMPPPGAPAAGAMIRSVLTSPAFLRDVAAGVTAATRGAAAAVDAHTFGYLFRIARGGNNDDRAAYVADTLPGGARAVRFLRATALAPPCTARGPTRGPKRPNPLLSNRARALISPRPCGTTVGTCSRRRGTRSSST